MIYVACSRFWDKEVISSFMKVLQATDSCLRTWQFKPSHNVQTVIASALWSERSPSLTSCEHRMAGYVLETTVDILNSAV
jgi:hypothetical protein